MAATAVEVVAGAEMVVAVPAFVVFVCRRAVYSDSCPVMIACDLGGLVYCSRTEERWMPDLGRLVQQLCCLSYQDRRCGAAVDLAAVI